MQAKSIRSFARIISLLLVFCFVAGFVPVVPVEKAYADTSIRVKKLPQGTIGVSRPRISLSMMMTGISDSPKAESFQMTLDSKEVKGTYTSSGMIYAYTPTEDLKPGEHKVEVTITLKGYYPMSTNWTFTVAKEAVSSVPEKPTAQQQKGMDSVNDYRKLHGLPTLNWSSELAMAAQSHASYLKANDVKGNTVSLHSEDSSKPGYTGASPMQRAMYANYQGTGVGEDASFGWSDISVAIDQLFDAPYHRFPFLIREATEIGIGMDGKYVILEFGMVQQETVQMVVTPAPDDHYVPVSFDGHEAPDPLRNHTSEAKYPVGYPIMAVLSGESLSSVKLEEATLKDSRGNSLAVLTNSPENDKELDNSVMVIPVDPLMPDSQYYAHIKVSYAENGQSKTKEKDWAFRTEPAATVGKQKLHADSDFYMKLQQTKGDFVHVATFKLGDNAYTLDGVKLSAKMNPLVIDGSSYLWVRDLANALGATVTWDETKRAAIYTKNGKTVTFYTDKAAYAVDQNEFETATPAKLYEGVTLIPLRLMSEALGAKVQFDDATKAITISY